MAKERIDARNQLDNYPFSMKNHVEDPEKLGKKMSEDEKSSIKAALKEAAQVYRPPGLSRLSLPRPPSTTAVITTFPPPFPPHALFRTRGP